MREVAVRVEAGTDGTFDPGDRVVFYGCRTRDWEDFYDPRPPTRVFHEHTHAQVPTYYFLAWGGSLRGTPARMADADGDPVAARRT